MRSGVRCLQIALQFAPLTPAVAVSELIFAVGTLEKQTNGVRPPFWLSIYGRRRRKRSRTMTKASKLLIGIGTLVFCLFRESTRQTSKRTPCTVLVRQQESYRAPSCFRTSSAFAIPALWGLSFLRKSKGRPKPPSALRQHRFKLGSRVERQTQAESLLARSTFGAPQSLGDAVRFSLLSSKCLQGFDLLGRPCASFRCSLSHLIHLDFKKGSGYRHEH
jgi:hypothetical protein